MSDDAAGAQPVGDRRRSPFCYQTHDALDTINAAFEGSRRATARSIYLAFTEAANRIGGAAARDGFQAVRAEIASSAGVSIDTLDRYAAAFEKLGLLVIERHSVGSVNLPNTWVLTDPPAPPGRTGAATPGRTGAAPRARSFSEAKKGPEEEDLSVEPIQAQIEKSESELRAQPPSPAKALGRYVDLDALMEVCGIKDGDPTIRQVVTYLRGRKHGLRAGSTPEPGIADLAWQEVVKWCDENTSPAWVTLAKLHAEPTDWGEMLARMIRERADQYHYRMPEIPITAKALRDWWPRLSRWDVITGLGDVESIRSLQRDD